jgi:integrase
MTEEDKAFFLRYAKDAAVHDIGDRRIEKYRAISTTAHYITGKRLLPMIKDISSLEATIEAINTSKKYKPATKKDCKKILGSMFNFFHTYKIEIKNKEGRILKTLEGMDAILFEPSEQDKKKEIIITADRSLTDAPKQLKKLLKHTAKTADKRLAKAVITREEIRELSKFGNTLDKAILWLLFESGMRIGEFIQLKKSDITEIKEGLLVRVPPGKSGEREANVVEATKFVLNWIEENPIKAKDAPLWISRTKEPLGRNAIEKRIRMCVERMNEERRKKGIPQFEKSFNPHNFRHSRASELGGEAGMTEAVMDEVFGWEIGSDMTKTYVHLTPEQVRRAVFRTYGKAKPEEAKQIITSWVCSRCKEDNPISVNYCGRCGTSQSGKVISEVAILKEQIKTEKSEISKLRAEVADMRGAVKKLWETRREEK